MNNILLTIVQCKNFLQGKTVKYVNIIYSLYLHFAGNKINTFYHTHLEDYELTLKLIKKDFSKQLE